MPSLSQPILNNPFYSKMKLMISKNYLHRIFKKLMVP
jgi:hypothetical protein